jgi:hypothetical protein
VLSFIILRPSRLRGIFIQGVLPRGWAFGGRPQGRAKRKDQGSDSAWNFNFNNGKRNSNHMDNSNNKRALCVRRSGE